MCQTGPARGGHIVQDWVFDSTYLIVIQTVLGGLCHGRDERINSRQDFLIDHRTRYVIANHAELLIWQYHVASIYSAAVGIEGLDEQNCCQVCVTLMVSQV